MIASYPVYILALNPFYILVPSLHPNIVPSLHPVLVPSVHPSLIPSLHPNLVPSLHHSFVPSVHPNLVPSVHPSLIPSLHPNFVPSVHPSLVPSLHPYNVPSLHTNLAPSLHPSLVPSLHPSLLPSLHPNLVPSLHPSLIPSLHSNLVPSVHPSLVPSLHPYLVPSLHTNLAPSLHPSLVPSLHPSLVPSLHPYRVPILHTNLAPSLHPSLVPSLHPSLVPSLHPNLVPSLHPNLVSSVHLNPQFLYLCHDHYISKLLTTDVEGPHLKASLEKPTRQFVTNDPRKFRDSFRSTSALISSNEGNLFGEEKGNRESIVENSQEYKNQTKSENQLIAGRSTENVFTTDYKEERTHNNKTVLTENTNLSERVGDEHVIEEKRHIAFLKVHKAASTTLQTMFFRFGYERNLSFVLPVKGNYFSKSAKVHEDLVPALHGDHYDILCNHGIFSYKIYSNVMPNDTVYLAVVRDPLDQFISAVNYYTDLYKFRYLMDVPGNRIENLIRYPEKYDTPLSYTMNSMARDFGFKLDHFFIESDHGAKQYLQHLGEIFDFVLIAEHLDESLILMKRLLNWSLKDILYMSKNVRGSEETISEQLMKKFRKRNKLDYMVYEFFYNKFKTELNKSKESIKAETAHFKRVLITVQNWCLDSLFGELTIEASEWNKEFVLTTTDCQLMTKRELNFIELLKGKTSKL
ncbi:uncharacterized protein LOC123534542 [Mercenaria mercenaria]|uniref:uncharacterized protein LOC123534542 n=1 Tax=Mercenaria mercenaria TaxID=6596 RepID=UPI00234EAAA4|nr:uncharacterized protein LOC123534542 [Mercenaria mercenaria]